MLLFLLALRAALACPDVQLPVGEPRDAWAGPLQMAGLCWAEDAPDVVLAGTSDPDVWSLAAGPGRVVTVRRPASEAAREDLAFLAASLLRAAPVTTPVTAPAPEPVRPPVARVPMVPPIEPPEPPVVPEPAVAVVVPEPPALPPAEPIPAPAPPAEAVAAAPIAAPPVEVAAPEPPAEELRPEVVPWVRVGTAVTARSEASARSSLELGALLTRGSARLGAAVTAAGRHEVRGLGETPRSWTALDGVLEGAWAPPGWVAGAGLGLSRRSFEESGVKVATLGVPFVVGDLGVARRLGEGARVELGVRAGADLRRTELLVNQDVAAVASPWALSARLAVAFRARR